MSEREEHLCFLAAEPGSTVLDHMEAVSSARSAAAFCVVDGEGEDLEAAIDDHMRGAGFSHCRKSRRGRILAACYVDLSRIGIRSRKFGILRTLPSCGRDGAEPVPEATWRDVGAWAVAVAFDRGDLPRLERVMLDRFSIDPDGVRRALARFAPARIAKRVLPAATAARKESAVDSGARARFRRALRSRPRRHLGFARDSRYRPGDRISFHGPDGCGKTTVIEGFMKLHEEFVALVPDRHVVQHLRCHVLPNARRWVQRGYDESRENYQEPHRGRPKPLIPSLAALAYYLVDYVAGHLLKTRRAMDDDRLVVFDRYSFDILADPRRIKIVVPPWILNAFVLLTPRPPVSFYLEGPPELIHARKQELTLEAIREQVQTYGDIALRFPEFVRLDIRREPERVAEEAFRSFVLRTFPRLEARPSAGHVASGTPRGRFG